MKRLKQEINMPFCHREVGIVLHEVFTEARSSSFWGTGDKGGQLGHSKTAIA
jgi:hypothetical protein